MKHTALMVLIIAALFCVIGVGVADLASAQQLPGREGFELGDASVIFRADGGYVYLVEIYYPSGYHQYLYPSEQIAPVATATQEAAATAPPTNTPRPTETLTWIPTPELLTVPYCEGRVTMMLSVDLNVRAAPWGTVIGKLYKGAGVSVYAARADGQGDDWYQIAYATGLAWVYADYIDSINCDGLPRQ